MSGISSIAGIPGALQSATSTIQRATKGLDKDESVVARSSIESGDDVKAMVDSRQQLRYTQAAARIVKVEDEMLQSLIDIRA